MIMLMEQLGISITLAIFGVVLGSYCAATVWRLRAKQLLQDKAEGEPVDEQEFKALLPLTKTTPRTDRSRCLHCGHQLAWYDLLPILSWSALKGKCRYCHTRIGWFEPLMEIGVATFFVVSFLLWPIQLDSPMAIVEFIVWLIAAVLLAILFAYDLKWFLLPDRVNFPLIAVGAVMATLTVMSASDVLLALISLAGAVAILSGLYWVLWMVSKGAWIGFGDIKLGLALALLLGEWQLALIALFTANLIGTLIVVPGMALGKLSRGTRVPFGPLLIAGAIIAMLVGNQIIEWYVVILF